ncbi:hypothetical protein GCM10010302_28400 [Streptomyces polychromogenes]|uniref:Uncharacterized protein n=1 Tax=Streptomyces polychromogenes TaxID=67342 RepID=A0ABP3F021_9ACTN
MRGVRPGQAGVGDQGDPAGVQLPQDPGQFTGGARPAPQLHADVRRAEEQGPVDTDKGNVGRHAAHDGRARAPGA